MDKLQKSTSPFPARANPRARDPRCREGKHPYRISKQWKREKDKMVIVLIRYCPLCDWQDKEIIR